MKARYGPISLSPPLSMSLSRRSHLDLLRGLRPPLEPRVEVALEGLELRAERAGRRGAIGTRVERRVLERRHHARDLGFQRRDRGLRLLELALRAAQVFARIAFRGWGHPVAFVHLPQGLLLGGADRGGVGPLRAHLLPLRVSAGELGHVPPVQDPNPRRQDRKSTRLNSSHLVISYAVFCLKKK